MVTTVYIYMKFNVYVHFSGASVSPTMKFTHKVNSSDPVNYGGDVQIKNNETLCLYDAESKGKSVS